MSAGRYHNKDLQGSGRHQADKVGKVTWNSSFQQGMPMEDFSLFFFFLFSIEGWCENSCFGEL